MDISHSLNDLFRYGMEASHEDFHRAIHENPDDNLNHLAYADWLQEQGKDEEADHIRRAVADGQMWLDSGVGLWSLNPGQTYLTEPFDSGVHSGRIRNLYIGSASPTPKHKVLGYTVPVEKPTPTMGLREGPDEVSEHFSLGEGPVRYASVPDHDVHPDYAPTGVAPRLGVYLQRVAEGNSDAGLLAEGILRTGSHDLLKILADKLDDDDHPLKSAVDWRHSERAVQIDKAFRSLIDKQEVPFYDRMVKLTPQRLLFSWEEGRSRPLSRTRALKAVRQVVPDATRTDLHHSLLRLIDGHEVQRHVENVQYGQPTLKADQIIDTIPEHGRKWAAAKLRGLGDEEVDPHTYPDTRPLNKRNYGLRELIHRYKSWKAPANGMVVKEHKDAVTGQWAQGGAFVRDLQQLEQPTPSTVPTSAPTPDRHQHIKSLIRRLRQKKLKAKVGG